MNRLQSNEVPLSPWAVAGEVRKFTAVSLAHGNGLRKLPFLFWRGQSGHSGSRFISRE